MKILGFRSDPSTPRYAIIDKTITPYALVNADSESRLCFPADRETEIAQLTWLYREFERIFHLHQDINRVIIKKGEFTQGDTNAKRMASYQEASLLIFCGLRNTQVLTKLYTSLGTNSTQVKGQAEALVGRTTRYWDSKMADAALAAWWGAENP